MGRIIFLTYLFVIGCDFTSHKVQSDMKDSQLVKHELHSFTCRKTIFGKRTIGELTLNFEPTSSSARLTMTFDSDPKCSFKAVWRFPESFPKAMNRENAHCEVSQESPFAIACDLQPKINLSSSSQALRAELGIVASGPAIYRSITFVNWWPSDVMELNSMDLESCSGIPVKTGVQPNQFEAWLMSPDVSTDFIYFNEEQCHLD
jgi:hypothetical protein